jgi:hypothetical protein
LSLDVQKSKNRISGIGGLMMEQDDDYQAPNYVVLLIGLCIGFGIGVTVVSFWYSVVVGCSHPGVNEKPVKKADDAFMCRMLLEDKFGVLHQIDQPCVRI